MILLSKSELTCVLFKTKELLEIKQKALFHCLSNVRGFLYPVSLIKVRVQQYCHGNISDLVTRIIPRDVSRANANVENLSLFKSPSEKFASDTSGATSKSERGMVSEARPSERTNVRSFGLPRFPHHFTLELSAFTLTYYPYP